MKKIILLSLLAALLLPLGACSAGQKKVTSDMSYLALAFEMKGYLAAYHTEGDPMLADLMSDMSAAMGENAPKKAVLGYMYADDPSSGAMVIEVFSFESAADAKALVAYLKDSDAFVEGQSEIRIDGTVVYMGYISALEIAEKTV